MSMNEIWALPGQPRIIVTGWDSCTGDNPMTEGSTYADKCTAKDIWDKLHPELRSDGLLRERGNGSLRPVYPGDTLRDTRCWIPSATSHPSKTFRSQGLDGSGITRTTRTSRARDNLNVMAGDFLGDPGGEGQQLADRADRAGIKSVVRPGGGHLSWTADPSASQPVTVSCHNPTVNAPPRWSSIPCAGAEEPEHQDVHHRLGLPRCAGQPVAQRFPGSGRRLRRSYLVACALGGSPLAPPGSSNGVGLGRIVIPLSAFGPLPLLSAHPVIPSTCGSPASDREPSRSRSPPIRQRPQQPGRTDVRCPGDVAGDV